MGVEIGAADGEYISLVECRECGERYEIDEKRANDCPHCYRTNFEKITGYGTDPELSWRD